MSKAKALLEAFRDANTGDVIDPKDLSPVDQLLVTLEALSKASHFKLVDDQPSTDGGFMALIKVRDGKTAQKTRQDILKEANKFKVQAIVKFVDEDFIKKNHRKYYDRNKFEVGTGEFVSVIARDK